MVAGRAHVDLHCHTSASFDSLASPAAVVTTAWRRGLSHLIVTDHDTIAGALEARDRAPDGLTVIIGEEIRTREGDLIGAFLHQAIPPGLPTSEAIAAVRAQGGLVGIPHPYDRFRGSLARTADDGGWLEAVAGTVDWIEAWNARLVGGTGNARAAELARGAGVPAVAVSDAHSTLEIGVAATAMDGDPSTPAGLRAALAGELELTRGRATYLVRAITPLAKVVQRARGRGRVRPAVPGGA